MAKGLMGLRGYTNGGGIGGPEDDWLKKLIRELQRRANIKGLPDDPSMMRFFPNLDADDLIHLSNFDIEYDGDNINWQRVGLGPEPHVVPPLSDIPTLWEDLRSMGIDPDDLIEGPSNTPDLGNVLDKLDNVEKSLEESKKGLSSIVDNFLRNVLGYSEEEVVQWHIKELIGRDSPPQNMNILDQPIHELDEAFRSGSRFDWGQSRDLHGESIDDLIRGAGGRTELNKFPLPPTARFLGPLGSNQLAKWKDAEKEAAMVAQIEKMRSDEALRVAERNKNRGIRGLFRRFGGSSIPWGSTVVPFLGAAAAAAVSPLALAAETAFDFAISPEPLGGIASEVPGAGRTWRESPYIDPSDEEVASWMQTLLVDSPYSQSQLARPSTTSQRAIEQLIRNARAGTPVNRYRR